jgi:hypothetical protein
MKVPKGDIVKHIALIISILAFLLLCILYPFLPGKYDGLAMPISIMVQLFGAAGLHLSIVGLLWLLVPKIRFILINISLYAGTFVMLILALFGMLIAGKIFGILTITLWVFILIQLKTKLKQLKATDHGKIIALPLYLISLPVLVLIFQLILRNPVTQWSRNRAIENADEFIGQLENFHSNYGRYPLTLQAMYQDYFPEITGIERYYYLPNGDSYNISFEQPRFLFDIIGTREWVVYNPRDEHRVFSHTSWFLLLSPEELERSQGWYESGNTDHPHWKYFLFD